MASLIRLSILFTLLLVVVFVDAAPDAAADAAADAFADPEADPAACCRRVCFINADSRTTLNIPLLQLHNSNEILLA